MCEFWKDFLSSQLFGIILGSLLTAGFTCFLDWLKSKREEKIHLKKRKEEAYFNMLNFYSSFITRTFVGINSLDIIHMAEENKGPLLIYGSKDVVRSFYIMEQTMNDYVKGNVTVDTVTQKFDDLVSSIRKELGIKD